MKKINLWLTKVPTAAVALFWSASASTLVALADSGSNSGAGNTTAQTTASSLGVSDKNGLITLICNFVNYFVWIVIVISIIMVLIAAFWYVTAEDDTEKTSKARWTLTYGAIGLAVALLATAFPAIVGSVAGTVTGGNAATQPSCVVGFGS